MKRQGGIGEGGPFWRLRFSLPKSANAESIPPFSKAFVLIESLFPAFPETDFPLRGRSTGKLTVLAGGTVRESSGAAEPFARRSPRTAARVAGTMPDEELMNRLCAAVLLFAVLFCLPRSAGAGEPLAAVSESELARIVHEGDGRPLVLVYWASWCVPCRHFREKLEKIRAGYPESELRMLAVSLDRDPGPAMAYLARSPLPYPARIGDAELIKARSGMPVPTTILYRRDGSVERELVGDVSEKRLGHYVGRIVRR